MKERNKKRKKSMRGRGQWADLVQKTWECLQDQAVGELSGCKGRQSHHLLGFDFVGETGLLSVLGGWQDGIKNFQFLPIWKVIKAPLQERKIGLTQVQSPKFCIKLKPKSGRAVTVSLPELWMAADANVLEPQTSATAREEHPQPAVFPDELSSGSSQLSTSQNCRRNKCRENGYSPPKGLFPSASPLT